MRIRACHRRLEEFRHEFFHVPLEIGFTTPPFGMLLFIMMGIAPKGTTLRTVSLAALPYILCAMLLVAPIIAIPDIALLLPRLL